MRRCRGKKPPRDQKARDRHHRVAVRAVRSRARQRRRFLRHDSPGASRCSHSTGAASLQRQPPAGTRLQHRWVHGSASADGLNTPAHPTARNPLTRRGVGQTPAAWGRKIKSIRRKRYLASQRPHPSAGGKRDDADPQITHRNGRSADLKAGPYRAKRRAGRVTVASSGPWMARRKGARRTSRLPIRGHEKPRKGKSDPHATGAPSACSGGGETPCFRGSQAWRPTCRPFSRPHSAVGKQTE